MEPITKILVPVDGSEAALAAYRLALACIYPRHRVRCALVWTDGPALMEIDAARLDDALAGLVGEG